MIKFINKKDITGIAIFVIAMTGLVIFIHNCMEN